MADTTRDLLRVYYGTGAPPNTTLNGALYVSTSNDASSINGIKKSQLYFDFDNTRYIISGDALLSHTFTVGGVSFDGHENKSVDTYTYSFKEGGTPGYFTVTTSKNGVSQGDSSVHINGIKGAAFEEKSAFLAANGTAVKAKALTTALTLSDGTNSVVYGSEEGAKQAYFGSKIIVANSSTSITAATTTIANGSVYLNVLSKKVSNGDWTVGGSVNIKGESGVTVTRDSDGAIVVTGTLYSPATLTFNNGGAGGNSGAQYNGSTPITISYNTIGAAAANTAITGASISATGISLSRANSNTAITANFPESLSVNISGKATTAGTADATKGTLTLKVNGGNTVTFNGATAEFDVTYAKLGVVPADYLPASVKERLIVRSSESAIKQLTLDDAQPGDVVKNSDATSGQLYYVVSYSERTTAGASFSNNGNTLSFVPFAAGSAAYADEAHHVSKQLTFSTAGQGATDYYNGSEAKTLSYNSIGAAAANTEITGASFGTNNKTLTLAKGSGNITVDLPAKAAINISGKADTAGVADSVAGTLTLNNNGTTATYNGGSSPTIYVGNKVIITGNTTQVATATAKIDNGSVYITTVKQTAADTWARAEAFIMTGERDI